MAAKPYPLELRFAQGDYGLSARRLHEFIELGQINVFNNAISKHAELNAAADFIDIVHFDGDTFYLMGFTLGDVRVGRLPINCETSRDVVLNDFAQTSDVSGFILGVQGYLDRCSDRQAIRNQHHSFLSPAKAGDAFGIPFVFSTLQRRLLDMGNSKAGAFQWLKTIENLKKKGLRAEELELSELAPHLGVFDDESGQITARELSRMCNFNDLRLSVIPVIYNAQNQIRFAPPLDRALRRTRKLPKSQTGQTREVAGFDPVLGYRVEQVAHQTLWGHESHWQAVLYNGSVLENGEGQSLFTTSDTAAELAALHAKQNFPKRLALGRFAKLAWTGGRDYREWLITLPYYPASYLSGHFDIRNVLAHVRCDFREGSDGERVLMVQEVQSDWAQRARRALSTGESSSDDEQPPPFFKEWSALAMKLVLLHAAFHGADAVAWTRGLHQVVRYNGLGAPGLIELYDKTLPREVNRILKPFGIACEMLGVFVPVNFGIKQSENGYEVYSPDDVLLGTAASLEDAQQLVPDGAHEKIFDVHGVRLNDTVSKALLEVGFPAWG